jgi:hypothetical protein
MRPYSKNGAMETVITRSFKNILTYFLIKACFSLLSEDGDGCNNDETIVKNRKVILKKSVGETGAMRDTGLKCTGKF